VARIIARTTTIKKLAIDRGINPSAHSISIAAGITYETVRKVMNGESPSDRTMAALMAYFAVPWDELFVLEDDSEPVAASR
jgi:transcriptional regulator with XRE-family HTH domain